MHEYNQKSVFITGGSSGIGKALAKEILSSGGEVTLCARDVEKLNQAKVDLLQGCPIDEGKIKLLSLDITNWELVAQQIPEFISMNGVPDMLINCAGAAHPGEFLDLDIQIFHWLMDTNFYGTVHMCKALVPGMLQKGSGHIVNISSAAGFLGVYGYTAYCATKYAVRGFSDALRAELKLKNIKMSLVFPPDTDTPQLAYESQFKPAITKALSGSAGTLSPQTVAKNILHNVSKGKYIIVPGFENAFLYHLSNLIGNKVYWLMDQMVLSAVKKVEKK
jgi:3-dehydrosphinganine reductase